MRKTPKTTRLKHFIKRFWHRFKGAIIISLAIFVWSVSGMYSLIAGYLLTVSAPLWMRIGTIAAFAAFEVGKGLAGMTLGSGVRGWKAGLAVLTLIVGIVMSLIASAAFRGVVIDRAETARKELASQRTEYLTRIRHLEAKIQGVEGLPKLENLREKQASLQASKVFRRTASCTDATLPASIRFCDSYAKNARMIIQRGQADEWKGKLEGLRKEFAALPVPSESEQPMMKIIAEALEDLGIQASEKKVEFWIAIITILAIEFYAVAVPMLAGATRQTQRKVLEETRQPKDLYDLLDLRKDKTGKVIIKQSAVAEELGKDRSTISRNLTRLEGEGRIKKTLRGGKTLVTVL